MILHEGVSHGQELSALSDTDKEAEKTLECIKLLTEARRIQGNDGSIKGKGSSGMACDSNCNAQPLSHSMQFGCEKVNDRLTEMVQ